MKKVRGLFAKMPHHHKSLLKRGKGQHQIIPCIFLAQIHIKYVEFGARVHKIQVEQIWNKFGTHLNSNRFEFGRI